MTKGDTEFRNGESELRVRLFTQGFAPSGAEGVPASIFDRLKRLEAEGVIDECEAEVWGRKVCRRIQGERPAIGAPVLETVREFRDWADRTGASLDRCFEEHEVHSEMTGEDRTEIRLPTVCLAVRYEDDLVAVFPHAKDGDEYTVTDGLATLESSRTHANRQPERLVH